jgi:hypothetical protein
MKPFPGAGLRVKRAPFTGVVSFHRIGDGMREEVGGERKVKGARFTLNPAPEAGFKHLVKGGTYFHIND